MQLRQGHKAASLAVGHPSLDFIIKRAVPGMHFQDQPHFCSQVKLPKPQIFLISQDLNYVFMCCSSTQKYSVLFEANTLKISKQGCFPPLCPAHLYPSELSVNSLSDYDLDAMSATTRLGVYFWCSDLNTGVPKGLWPKLSFWISRRFSAVRRQC